MLTVLLALIAPAAEDSRLLFETSPGARVEVLPTHAPEWFELAVLDNRVGLHEQLPRSARFVKDIETVGVGAGTTYIRIQAERDDLRLTAEKVPKGVRLVLEVADGPREIEPVFEPAPYEQIVGDSPPPRRVRNPADVPIRPFTGDARTYRYVPDEVPFGLDDWSGVGDEKLPAQLQVPPTTWEAADGFREVLTGPSGRGDRRAAELLLAQVYLAKGIPHEAAYYLRDVVGKPGPWEPALPHLQLARAEIGRGNLDAAEAQCREAAKAGGDELVVLRCLGAVALQTGHPAPRHLALAIEQRATSGKALLLAAELMMADQDYPAAQRLAATAVSDLVGKGKARAQLIVGDTAFFANDLEAAREAWTVAGRYGFADVVRVRRVMSELSETPRRKWSRHVPYLEKLARLGGEASLEANYLLGQIAEHFPDPDAAARHYHAVWDANAQTALRSDVPERLIALCDRYVDHLEADERWTDLAVFADTCWRPDLDLLAADTRLSESWANAYNELGLVNEALNVQRRVVRVRNELEREEVGPLVDLAALYTRSGRPREALETVEYVRKRLPSPGRDDPRLLLRQAEAWAAMDDTNAARRLWTQALGHPSTRAQARRSLGLLEAYEGRCASAVLHLTDDDAPQQLARARCALALGRAAEAERDAGDVLVNGDDAFATESAWLVGAAAFAQGRPEVVAEAEGVEALWAALLAEEGEAAAFDAMIGARAPR